MLKIVYQYSYIEKSFVYSRNPITKVVLPLLHFIGSGIVIRGSGWAADLANASAAPPAIG